MQNKADVVGCPIEVPELDEAVPLGAAILAGIGVGVYRDEEDAFGQVYRPGRTYHPHPELTAQYARWFEIFAGLYPALQGLTGVCGRRFETTSFLLRKALPANVGWVERSEPHHFSGDLSWWGSLRSTHPTLLGSYPGLFTVRVVRRKAHNTSPKRKRGQVVVLPSLVLRASVGP